jgi:hypothetical protein
VGFVPVAIAAKAASCRRPIGARFLGVVLRAEDAAAFDDGGERLSVCGDRDRGVGAGWTRIAVREISP